MDSLPLLQIAGAVVFDMLGYTIPIKDGDDSFEFVFSEKRKNLPPYEAGAWLSPSKLTLTIAIAVRFEIAPLRNAERTGILLSNSVEPFLEGLYNGPGSIVLHPVSDGSIIPAYEAVICYEPLEDDEVYREVWKSFARGARALTLLCPIFWDMERGYLPDALKRMNMLAFQHAAWEINALSSDVPKDAVRLPRRLFGGNSSLLPQ